MRRWVLYGSAGSVYYLWVEGKKATLDDSWIPHGNSSSYYKSEERAIEEAMKLIDSFKHMGYEVFEYPPID